jgi:hypothetical protein
LCAVAVQPPNAIALLSLVAFASLFSVANASLSFTATGGNLASLVAEVVRGLGVR